MRYIRSLRWTMPLLVAASLLTGCGTALVGPAFIGLGLAAGTRSLSERSERDLFNDARLRIAVKGKMSEAVESSAAGFVTTGAEVYDGRVLLTGTLPTQDESDAAEAAVRELEGVVEVFNQIVIGPAPDPAEYVVDRKIWTSLSLRIIENDLVAEAIDMEKSVVNRVVYVIGTARSLEIRQELLHLISETDGVRGVVSFIEIPGETPPDGGEA